MVKMTSYYLVIYKLLWKTPLPIALAYKTSYIAF